MGDEHQNTTTAPGGGLSLLAWPLPFFLVVYPLSVGPVAKIVGPAPPPHSSAPSTPPLGYLNDHSQRVRSFYDWYAKLWGIRL